MMSTIRLLFFLLAATNSFSQKLDTAFLSEAKAHAVTHYEGVVNEKTFLFSGIAYVHGPAIGDQHPFFGNNAWSTGTVTYHDYKYDGIFLRYDIVTDALVIQNYQGQLLALTREFVDEFRMGMRAFRFYGSDKQALPAAGYYEVLYDGCTTVLARHTKSPDNRIESGRVVIEYRERTEYFLHKEGRFFPVTSKKTMLGILSDRKNELKQFIRKNRLYFSRKTRQTFIERVAAHYDTLSDSKK